MSRYKIWNKQDVILTPIGEVLTAEQWIDRYPIAGVETIKVVCAGGEINGAFFGTLGQMKDMYEKAGCDFTACTTDQEVLEVIEAFEDAQNAPSAEKTPEERQAEALEAIASGQSTENAEALDILLTGEDA